MQESKKKYYYKAFGLNIESCIELPELWPSDKGGDVTIEWGNVPNEIPGGKVGVQFQANNFELLLFVDHIAGFHIKEGKNITINRNESVDEKEIRLFLLGSAFGALIHQRGSLPLHGSTISLGDYCVAFSGISGAGKSSLARYYTQNGYQLLSDDVSVINNNTEGHPIVSSGYPQMKLWPDTLIRSGDNPKDYSNLRIGINKKAVPVKDLYLSDDLPLKKIFILQVRNSKEFEIKELQGIEKFNALKRNTYRYQFIDGLYGMQTHFSIVTEMSKHIKAYRINRPSQVEVKDLADFVSNYF